MDCVDHLLTVQRLIIGADHGEQPAPEEQVHEEPASPSTNGGFMGAP